MAGLLGALMLLTACGGQSATDSSGSSAADTGSSSSGSSSSSSQMANPYTSYETLAEAAKAAGFGLNVPGSIGDYGHLAYQVMNAGQGDAMIQITYTASSDASGSSYTIRKAAGNDDISGDYNEYAQTRSLSLGKASTKVTVKGDADGAVKLATWVKDGYAYSLGAYDGTSLSEEEFATVFEQIS
ncbi:hypothetical protein KIH75_04395 [Bifidobacterium sp. 64T4]|uniref:hypothetical protein n=1 Tax=Bifidobacterium pongonis TaxID=2834432 RepID=UPI001C59AF47|nr:hypothetical protein [Bifidobacterium pongonis]MBW3094593.1 hypothetical protein [Bifidobacterium pongonis]